MKRLLAPLSAALLSVSLMGPALATDSNIVSTGPGFLGYLFKYPNLRIRSFRDSSVPPTAPNLDAAIARATATLKTAPGLSDYLSVTTIDVDAATAFAPPYFDESAKRGDVLIELVDQPLTVDQWGGHTTMYVPNGAAPGGYEVCYTAASGQLTRACNMSNRAPRFGVIEINNRAIPGLLQSARVAYEAHQDGDRGNMLTPDDVLANLVAHELGHALGMGHEEYSRTQNGVTTPSGWLTCAATSDQVQPTDSVSVMANGAFCYPMSTTFTGFDLYWLAWQYQPTSPAAAAKRVGKRK